MEAEICKLIGERDQLVKLLNQLIDATDGSYAQVQYAIQSAKQYIAEIK